MIKSFHTDKVLFEIRQADVPFNNNETFKLFYDGDYALPLGRVRLFRIKGMIYGRINYYVNLEAYKKYYMKLSHLFPSLTLLVSDSRVGSKAEKVLCCSLNRNPNTDNRIHNMGDQLYRRKVVTAGLQSFRDAKVTIDNLPTSVDEKTDPYAHLFFMTYRIACTMYVHIETRKPAYIMYPGRNGYERVDLNEFI